MPIYLYWGEADFAIAKAIQQLKAKLLDPDWVQFNDHRFVGDSNEATIEALNEVMTPSFGLGEKLVWLADTTILQQCSADLLAELQRTLPIVAPNCHLLLTTKKKPDGRLKSTKLVQKYAQVKEFSLIPYWDTKALTQQVRQLAQEIGIKLTPAAIELLVESVGNNTRQLWQELAKLSVYCEAQTVIGRDLVASLVTCNTQNSLQLAAAMRDGKTAVALSLIQDLLNHNEPPLRIVATLVKQFRTWAIVKSLTEAGETEYRAIASAAEIPNPNRVKYILPEIKSLTAQQLLSALPLLLELEYGLKRGEESLSLLQTQGIKICQLNSVK
ncbi:MAG TPA: DNA polymerase III subunit delta [Xenococcaceae cyanobacterium]